MLNRQLKKSEIALILIVLTLFLGLFYHQFIYQRVEDAKIAYDTTDIEVLIQTEQAKAIKIKTMEAEIAANKDNETGQIVSYNNIKEEINCLNDIFGQAESFNFSFNQAKSVGTAVRRDITASFTAESYDDAKAMLKELHDCEYRCIIRDINVTTTTLSGDSTTQEQQQNINSGAVSVSFKVTFFETLYDAETTDGLYITDASTTE